MTDASAKETEPKVEETPQAVNILRSKIAEAAEAAKEKDKQVEESLAFLDEKSTAEIPKQDEDTNEGAETMFVPDKDFYTAKQAAVKFNSMSARNKSTNAGFGFGKGGPTDPFA